MVAIVYLDQNKWIDLARARLGKSREPDHLSALASVERAAAAGTAVFPLAATHYLETARGRRPGRRERLGKFMWEISGGRTLASYREIVLHELDVALTQWFPHIRPEPLQLVSEGAKHAFGQSIRDYRLPSEYRTEVSDQQASVLEAAVQFLIEESIITGKGPGGLTMPAFRESRTDAQFAHHLRTLHDDILTLPPEKRDDALVAIEVMDILEPLNEKLEERLIPPEWLRTIGKEGLRKLVENMPSRRVDLQLHRQWIRNPALRPDEGHLRDWSGLGPAVAYCDIVICEKHFADLVLRNGFRPKAAILTDVVDLQSRLSKKA